MTLKEEAIAVVKKLQDAGYEAVFAGGCVRDEIMNIEPKDYDIATSATPEQIEKLFYPLTLPIGADFGVMLVIGKVGKYEIATFRQDGNYTDGRRPDNITFSSMKEDALRRDLTINALFIDPITDKLYDFIDGVIDIHNKVIRFVGNPNDRIKEDHIRILRAIRFATRLGFELTPETKIAIAANAQLTKTIVPERLAMELTKILKECNPIQAFKWFDILDILKYILPDLIPMIGCQQPPEFHPEGDVYNHTLIALDYVTADQNKPVSNEVLWATLLHDVGKPDTSTWDDEAKRFRFNGHDQLSAEITKTILTRLKFSNEFIDNVVDLVSNHMRMAFVTKLRKSKLRRFLAKKNINDHLLLHEADCAASHGGMGNIEFCKKKMEEFLTYEPTLDLPEPLVTGRDLIAMGLIPGPHFKIFLDNAMDLQLEGKDKDFIIKEIQDGLAG